MRHRVAALGATAVLALVGSIALGGAVPVRAESGPFATGSTNGEVGCDLVAPLQPTGCPAWDDTSSGRDWQFEDDKHLAVSGLNLAGSVKASLVEQDLADELGTLTMTSTLETSLAGGGRVTATTTFNASFPTRASSFRLIGTAATEAHGSSILEGIGEIRIQADCFSPEGRVDIDVMSAAGSGEPAEDADSQQIEAEIPITARENGLGFCQVEVRVFANGASNRAPSGTESGSSRATLSLTVLAGDVVPSPGPSLGACALGGTVRDGQDATDGHANPLGGVLVQLWRDDQPLGDGVPTAADGRYCIPGGTAEPGQAVIRATLVDATRNPAAFATTHQGDAATVSMDRPVEEADFGRSDVDVAFGSTTERPWLADVADVHWQATRFVDWLYGDLALDPAVIGPFTIETGSSHHTSYIADASDPVVFINDGDTPFASRNGTATDGPENEEWHEISHHVAHALGIAPTDTAPACEGRTNHGGWSNDSTCDSLAEGFASFLATLGSLDIDAGRGEGFADPGYAGFGSLELNGYRPWSSTVHPGHTTYDEDLAVAQLLWDLADDTPAEPSRIVAQEPVAPHTERTIDVRDRVALGTGSFIRLLALARPTTIADLYDALAANASVPAALRKPDVDLDADGTPDVGPLAEVMLLHGFHPTHALDWSNYRLGDPIGPTQPGANHVAERRHLDPIPGSAIRLENRTDAVVSVVIDVKDSFQAAQLHVSVPAHATLLQHLEVPPYWAGALAAGQALPACASADAWPVSITVSAPGTAALTVSSCTYLHSVAAGAGEAAVTYTIESSASLLAAVAGPVGVVLVLILVAAVALAGALLFRRRGRASA